jgi:hypothetical protein
LSSQDLFDLLSGINLLLASLESSIKQKKLKLVIHGFDGFSPVILFDSDKDKAPLKGFQMQRFPLLGKTIQQAAEKLYEDLLETTKHHTPWMFILSGGLSFDNLNGTHKLLEKVKTEFGLRYMSFILSARRFKNRYALENHYGEKRPIGVADRKIPLFFNWLIDDIEKRLATTAEETIKSNRELIEKWAVR